LRKIANDTKLNFKKDLSNIELMGIEHILNSFETDIESEVLMAEDYGLAYTSSSSYAMYNVTEHVVFDGLTVSHFSITDNDMLIMVCTDDDENNHCYEIEGSDY
jgi:hypothetical protein